MSTFGYLTLIVDVAASRWIIRESKAATVSAGTHQDISNGKTQSQTQLLVMCPRTLLLHLPLKQEARRCTLSVLKVTSVVYTLKYTHKEI
jgi:hypothetical protein